MLNQQAQQQRHPQQHPGQHGHLQPLAIGQGVEQGRIGGQYAVVGQHQFQTGDQVHARQCRQQWRQTQHHHGKTVQCANCQPAQQGQADRLPSLQPGVVQAAVDRRAQAQIGRQRQIKATGNHIGATANHHTGQARGENAENRRLGKHIGNIARAEEIRRTHGEHRQNCHKRQQRTATQQQQAQASG